MQLAKNKYKKNSEGSCAKISVLLCNQLIVMIFPIKPT